MPNERVQNEPVSSQRVTWAPARTTADEAAVIWAALRAAGAVIVTGAASTPEAFAAFTERFATRFRVHQDPSRRRYASDDTTQGVAGGTDFIDLHAERSYLPAPPELLFFCCLRPSSNGGATMVCDGAAVAAALSPEDTRDLQHMYLRWRTRLERPMWQRMWNIDDPAQAMTLFAEDAQRHGTGEPATCVRDGDALEVDCESPMLASGWIGGRPAFASYLLLHRHEPDGPQVTLTDGRPVPAGLLGRVAQAASDHTVDIQWERGDVAILDNTRCMHGRRAFSGGERQILVRMGDVQPRLRE